MNKLRRPLFVLTALSIIAISVIMVHKDDIALDETLDCPSVLMRGAPTIKDYGKNYATLQTLSQKKILVGKPYEYVHIIFGPPYKAKVLLVSYDNQINYLVTIEDVYTSPSPLAEPEHIKYHCKQPVDGFQKSPLNDISSLFINLNPAKWELFDAIELYSNSEPFESYAIYHYVIYIKGKSIEAPGDSAKFDATVDVLSFETTVEAQEYFQLKNYILKRNALGYAGLTITIIASEHESYCYHNSDKSAGTGCIFIGRSDDMVVEIKLFPQSEKADLDQVKVYWPEFVMNLWPSVLESYGPALKAP